MAMPRHRLRELREAADKTQQEAADAIGVGYRTYCRWEQGGAVPRRGFRTQIAEAFKVTETDVAQAFDEVAAPNGQSLPAGLDAFAALEQGASQVWAFEPLVIHGLLQTSEYATAVEAGDRRLSESGAKLRVELRIARQEVLWRRPNPLRLDLIIGESSLWQVAGGPEVMAAQLKYLL